MTKKIQRSYYPEPDIHSSDIRELFAMHTYCRPHNHETTELFCNNFLDKLPGMTIDAVGNRILRIGDAPVLWSSHTDTVHKDGGKQRLAYGDGMLSLASSEKRNCLGADDTAGVWLMRQMIKRRVEGLYIFHAGEEVGGVGSTYIANHTPEVLDGIRYAIALDRRGVTSVITSQMGTCCSTTFAEALSDALGGYFGPDDTGTFTDTANYTSIVPECTNLSVGYYNAHSSQEILDIGFLAHLLTKLCALDVSQLPCLRDPTVDDWRSRWSNDDRWRDAYETYDTFSSPDLVTLCDRHPEVAADILRDLGIDESIFESYLFDAKYNIK